MELMDIVGRARPPEPWAEGENIPWHDPAFSWRMLAEHLSQEHDAASRRLVVIEKHVEWIHRALLGGRPTRVLDLGCGPGLYTSRLAELGHQCVGIDYSPASILYATETAQEEGLRCAYRCEDIRSADYGAGLGLVMLIFGEFNVFRPADAALILNKARRALAPGGLLLLEPHTFDAVQQMGNQMPHWYSAERGLFSDRPHLYLEESYWDEAAATATTRYYIVDAQTAAVTRYASTLQAYTDEQYWRLLTQHGYTDITLYPALAAPEQATQSDLIAISARKPQP